MASGNKLTLELPEPLHSQCHDVAADRTCRTHGVFSHPGNTPCCSCFTATEPHLSFGRGKQHKERNKSIYNYINLCKANPGIKYMVYHRNLDQRYTATSCLHQSVTPQLLLLSLQQTALPQLSPPISIRRRGTSSNGTSWYSTW